MRNGSKINEKVPLVNDISNLPYFLFTLLLHYYEKLHTFIISCLPKI